MSRTRAAISLGCWKPLRALGPSQRDFIKRVSRLLSRTGAEGGDGTSSTLGFPPDGDGVGLATTSMPARPAQQTIRHGTPRGSAATGSSSPWRGEGSAGSTWVTTTTWTARSPSRCRTPSGSIGPEDIESYLAEARDLARLDHPHIVPVYDVGRTADGLCYIVSKWSRAATWRRGSSTGRSPPTRRRSWWRRRPRPCTMRTPTAWSTATSSRRTSCIDAAGRPVAGRLRSGAEGRGLRQGAGPGGNAGLHEPGAGPRRRPSG